jgi:hypothetical protein
MLTFGWSTGSDSRSVESSVRNWTVLGTIVAGAVFFVVGIIFIIFSKRARRSPAIITITILQLPLTYLTGILAKNLF